jgi:hypothetical protein
MSKKYIGELLSYDFVYPNNTVSEYDLEIVHDINNNSVSGTVNSFSATTISSTGITFSLGYTWNLNNAEPWIRNSNTLGILSVNMLAPGQKYYKPWRVATSRSNTNVNLTSNTETFSFFVSPSQMGISSFPNGVYYFEIRFIGHRAIYPVCATLNLVAPTPLPTPSPTATGVGPTPTPTGTATPTPTVTGTFTPTPTFTATPSPTPTGGVTLNWNYTETNTDGEMYLYVNGNVIENRFSTSSGTYTLAVGDTVNCEVIANGCSNPNIKANAYTISNRVQLTDAACADGNTSLFTSVYTVVSGDVGNTITLSMYSLCSTACV